MKKQNGGEFKGLLTATAVCPVCKDVHIFRLNPGYPPSVHGPKRGETSVRKSYRLCSWKERVNNYSFRVLCDRCLAARASPEMRKQLEAKGWEIK